MQLQRDREVVATRRRPPAPRRFELLAERARQLAEAHPAAPSC